MAAGLGPPEIRAAAPRRLTDTKGEVVFGGLPSGHLLVHARGARGSNKEYAVAGEQTSN